jgi:hypothetical protein
VQKQTLDRGFHPLFFKYPQLPVRPAPSADSSLPERKEHWMDMLRASRRSPSRLKAPLGELERTGDLIPIASADVQNFQGNRIELNRISIPVAILQVKH